MLDNLANWRERIRHLIGQQIAPGAWHAEEVEQRFNGVLNFELPTDAELVAMQERGEMPPDKDLLRGWL